MESKALQRKEHSTGLIAILTSVEASREFERTLTLSEIIDNAIPICELKQQVGQRNVAIALDVQLTRLVASLNLKWNVNDSQIKDIVQDLIEQFPNESIEDFVLCFKKARKGQFGELMRLDSPIIFTWMKAYLEEKYQQVEAKWKAKKEEEKKQVAPKGGNDWFKVWKESVDKLPHSKRFDLTQEEIEKEGQVKPPPIEYNPSPVAQIEMINRHKEKITEARRKYFLSAKPDASEEEIEAYLKKFDVI